MLKVLPSGACQQLLISPQVSYLTTLNNVYRSETDNKGTPNTEAEFRPSGWDSIRTQSELQHYINRKHASSPLCGQQHRRPWAQKSPGTYSHLDLDTADKRTNQFVLLWFRCHQASVFFQPEQGHEQPHPSDHCWSSSFALLPCQSTSQYHKCTVCRVQRQLSSTEEKSKLVTSHRRKGSRGEWISPAGGASSE